MAPTVEELAKALTSPPPKTPTHNPIALPRELVGILEGLARASEWLTRAASQICAAAQREPWRSALRAFGEIILNWPRDEYGRPLEPEEFIYGFAAAAAVEKTSEDPKALDEFLLEGARGRRGRPKLTLGLRAENEEQLQRWRLALWEIVKEELEKPISESGGWLFSARCRDKLRTELLAPYGRVRDMWEDRTLEDEPWESDKLKAVRTKKKKHLPVRVEFDPEQHGGVEEDPTEGHVLTNAGVVEMLVEFQRKELEKFYRQLEDVLSSERQYQVLMLRAKGYTHKDIGRELGIADSTSKSHLARAMKNPHVRRLAEGWM